MLILFKFIIIRDFSFRQITNVDEVAKLMISSEIFWTWSFVTKEFRISFIVFLSLNDIKYEDCFNFSKFFSSRNETSMNISSLNWSKSNLKSDLCFIKIERIFFLYFDFQWSLMSEFKFFSFSDVSRMKKFVEFTSKFILRLKRFLNFKKIEEFEVISSSLISTFDFFKRVLITFISISMKSSMHSWVKVFKNYSILIFIESSSKFVKNTLFMSSKIIAFIFVANEFVFEFS
jgi:hypothetical protein